MEHAQPLTLLAEDERLFRDSVREFAEGRVKPLVREMDEQAKIPRSLVDQLFDPGVSGHQIPETAAPAAVLPRRPRRRRAVARGPSVGVLVDVQNTLVVNALMRWGNEDIKRRYLTKLASATSGPMRCRKPVRRARSR